MDNSFIIKLFLNGKDVTEQYSVINAKIYRACNKIDKATISISADIIDNSQFEIPDNKIFNPGTELKFQAGPTDKVNTLFEGCVTTHQLKINSDFIKMSVKDLEGKEMKELLINNQEISFKNSDIMQENGSVKSTRVLDKSSQLLRKKHKHKLKRVLWPVLTYNT